MCHCSDIGIGIKLQGYSKVINVEAVHVALVRICYMCQVEFILNRKAFINPEVRPPSGADQISKPEENMMRFLKKNSKNLSPYHLSFRKEKY